MQQQRSFGSAGFCRLRVPRWILERNNHLTSCRQRKGFGFVLLSRTFYSLTSMFIHSIHTSPTTQTCLFTNFTKWIWLWAKTSMDYKQKPSCLTYWNWDHLHHLIFCRRRLTLWALQFPQTPLPRSTRTLRVMYFISKHINKHSSLQYQSPINQAWKQFHSNGQI